MRLLILSDLHLELWRDQGPRFDAMVSRPDVVILAGDIHTGGRAVDWAARTFTGLPVLYVHGNHEAYGANLEDSQAQIEAACSTHRTVKFMNCTEIVINGVRFLGATLWTDFRLFGDDNRPSAMRSAEAEMTDYKRIRLAAGGYRKLRTGDTSRFHAEHKSWLRRKLDEPYAGATVVITHMAPSMQSIPEDDVENQISAAYASRMEDLVQKADVWIHGHIHRSLDYRIGRCQVVCNPCGYRQRDGCIENASFDPNLTIEVKRSVVV